MPKVSQEHLDARRGQILDAARRCFLRDGFHATSMQDLFAEAGLSAGAVYRYFSGKDDVILAIAEENLRDVVGLIRALGDGAADGGVGDALASVLELVRARHADSGVGGMAVLVWSEALRKPALAARFEALLDELRAELVEVVRAQQAAGALPADPEPDALARLVMMIVPGYLVQLALSGEQAVQGVPEAARALWPAVADRAGPLPRPGL